MWLLCGLLAANAREIQGLDRLQHIRDVKRGTSGKVIDGQIRCLGS